MITSYQEMRDKLPMQFKLESSDTSYFGDYMCDTVEDLAYLPESCAMGSYARVLSTASIYRKNSSGVWVLQQFPLSAKKGER